MLHIIKSNDVKKLTHYLAKDYGTPSQVPFELDVLCAPDAIHGRLKVELAKMMNIFVGAVKTPRHVAEQIISGFLEEGRADPNYGRDALTLAVATSIHKRINDPAFSSLRNYFGDSMTDKKVFSFAAVVGNLFGEYMMYRPHMLQEWKKNANEWQSRLFQDVIALLGENHFGAQALNVIRNLASGQFQNTKLPPRIFVFGISNLPPLLLQLFAAISGYSNVFMYVISPSTEFFAYDGKDNKDEDTNSILQLLGRQAGYFQGALIDIAQQVPVIEVDDFLPSEGTTILSRLQKSVLQNTPLRLDGVTQADNSIQFHQCASVAREIDELKNVILHSVEKDKMLPSDIVVMAPNINNYAAHIESAFSDSSIPFSIADRTKSEAAGVVEAIVQLLDLVDGRLGLREVFTLLDNESVCKRFSLSRDDVKKCFLWCKEAKIKSCIDPRHRSKMGLIPCKENTWRFGLERLFLGVAMESFSLFQGVSALSGFVGTDVPILGRLTHFLETLFSFVALCEGVKSVSDWCHALEQAVAHLFDEEIEADTLVHFRTTLQHLKHGTIVAEFKKEVDFDGFRSLLKGKFSSIQFHSSGSSGIRFSSFRYLRGERCKLVALIGMRDGGFPVEQRTPSFDLISSHPKPQDKDAKHDGYQMFLESILGAIDKFFIFCSGDTARQEGTDVLCIPARELKNQIERSLASPVLRQFSEECVYQHPANSFNSIYFDTRFPKFFSYRSTDLFAARAQQQQMNHQVDVVSTLGDHTEALSKTPAAQDVVTAMSVRDFLRFWKNPLSFYLQEKLGFTFRRIEESPSDEAPINLSGLDEWTVGKIIVDGVLQQKNFRELQLLIRSLGVAPAGNLGNFFSQRTYDRAVKIADRAKDIIQNYTEEQSGIDIMLKTAKGQLRLYGMIDNVWGGTMLSYSYSLLKHSHLLNSWLKHLLHVYTSASAEKVKTISIFRNGDYGEQVSFTARPDENRLTLNQIAEFTLNGLTEPIPFLPDFSAVYAERSKKMDLNTQQAFLQRTLHIMERQLRDDASLEGRCLFEMDIFANNGARFHHLSTAVMQPLFECVQKQVLK